MVADGSGAGPYVADPTIAGDRSARIAPPDGARAGTQVDPAAGYGEPCIAPGGGGAR